MKNPYEVLGVPSTATDEQVKEAYRALAKKYHPDQHGNNPLSDLAQEKMQEINEAYDAIIRMRRSGGQSGNTNRYADIRNLIRTGRLFDAESLLDGIPVPSRDAEWYFLKGSVLYKKGWLDDAFSHFSTAVNMDPNNREYRQAYDQLNHQRNTGGYRVQPTSTGGGCSACDVCQAMICADCCCDCI